MALKDTFNSTDQPGLTRPPPLKAEELAAAEVKSARSRTNWSMSGQTPGRVSGSSSNTPSRS